MPKISTNLIGTRLAKAIRPKPSVSGLRGREGGQQDDDGVARYDQPVDRPALQNAQDADDDRRADRDRHGVAQGVGVGFLGRRVVGQGAGRGHGVGRLLANRDQGGLGHGGAEAEAESEQQQPGNRALARESLGERLADREQGHGQALDEDRQAAHDEQQADQDVGEILDRLLEHRDLEEGDDEDDRRQVAQRPGDEAQQ
jgi:hypothetical protein